MNVPAATLEPGTLHAFNHLLELKLELLNLAALKVFQFSSGFLEARAHLGRKRCLPRDHVSVHRSLLAAATLQGLNRHALSRIGRAPAFNRARSMNESNGSREKAADSSCRHATRQSTSNG
jgi:hypothetical protein